MFITSIPGQADLWLGQWDTVAAAAESALHASASTGSACRVDSDKLGACLAMIDARSMSHADAVEAIAEGMTEALTAY